MILKKDTSVVSWGDFLDVYHKIRQKGMSYLFSKLHLSHSARVSSKWDLHTASSDFWEVPEIVMDWNKSISGDENKEYEDYVAEKYFKGKTGLKILSVGCGDGSHERKFAVYPAVEKVVGIDIAEMRVKRAREMAQELKLPIEYIAGDFFKQDFEKESFDVILFSSSLHHFSNISTFLQNYIKPLLKNGGLLVVYEFSGPNRLQWRNSQLKEANRILQTLPNKFKTLYDGKTLKKKVYRPGLLRMLLVDPSEAPDSENLVKGIHDNFTVLEEAKLGWNILHSLLKGIAHNFVSDDVETKKVVYSLIEQEKKFMQITKENDAIFGVYRKD
ncbi:class I SAM-dependent methyltransferase [Flavobacterium sp. AG291]|uniref:class I SAM-dependent methyltransferase n=1 Tax=Flavobacterium sp. AG291 TaxID=2184000 RepID=UPI000E0AEE3C|nr:class I SAM-dependent methyltransferase [Flavobacterium sp. AG291]RDI05830.1 methyltransferase family protein [Flavobacterium sp. AG291]